MRSKNSAGIFFLLIKKEKNLRAKFNMAEQQSPPQLLINQTKCGLLGEDARHDFMFTESSVHSGHAIASCSVLSSVFSQWNFLLMLFLVSPLLWTTQPSLYCCQTNGCCGWQHKMHHFLCARKHLGERTTGSERRHMNPLFFVWPL